jgi:thiol-disulfide isomerase/thioredoxin
MKLKLLIVLAIITIFVVSGCSKTDEGKIVNQDEITGEVVNDNHVNNDFENSEKVVVYFFWGDGCPHCTTQKSFMEELENKYPKLEVKMFETWKNPENANLFREIAKAYGTEARGVPATFIGEKF